MILLQVQDGNKRKHSLSPGLAGGTVGPAGVSYQGDGVDEA